jgi:GMP synthase (glutamine-hydrolysing)
LLDAGFLACVATRIVNEIKGIHQVNRINRVARDHTPKPPGTIAWE